MDKYEYRTAVVENVFQSISQSKKRRERDNQMVGNVFTSFMETISKEGWRIIAVTSIADVMVYTLERKIK